MKTSNSLNKKMTKSEVRRALERCSQKLEMELASTRLLLGSVKDMMVTMKRLEEKAAELINERTPTTSKRRTNAKTKKSQ